MRLIDIVNARGALQKLVAQDLPLRTAYKIVSLAEACNRHLSFFSQMRQKLGALPEETKLAELESFEVSDLAADLPIEIRADDNIRLSPADVKALEPFVRFIF